MRNVSKFLPYSKASHCRRRIFKDKSNCCEPCDNYCLCCLFTGGAAGTMSAEVTDVSGIQDEDLLRRMVSDHST
jgi:hypothetical protein